MAAKNSMLACITATGDLHVYDIRNGGKALHPSANMAHLLNPSIDFAAGPAPTIEKFQVKSNGVAVIITSHPSAYIFDASKAAFTALLTPHQLSGSPLIASIPSSTAGTGGGRQRGNNAPSGPVSAIEAEVADLYRKKGSLLQDGQETPEWWVVAMTLQHLDMRMKACELLESKEEYKAALKAYAQCIGKEAFKVRAEEMVKDLVGPLYWYVLLIVARQLLDASTCLSWSVTGGSTLEESSATITLWRKPRE